MPKTVLYILFTCLLYRAFSDCEAQPPDGTTVLYKTEVAQRFSKALQVPTISADDPAAFDSVAYTLFRELLEESFPLVHTKLERTVINNFSYIYKWQGEDQRLDPFVLMAHQDVVPVEEEARESWTFPAFSGTIARDTIWGRGAVDDKGTLMGILEAAEALLQQKQSPERTIYFCFGHDEETSGTYGAAAMAAWFKQKGIHPALVLDEGLEIIYKNYIPLEKPVALIGVGEKGYASFELTANIPGGHSAAPPDETAIDLLNGALQRIHKNPMPAVLTETTKEFLLSIKNLLPGKMRFAISNRWLFKNRLLKEMGKNNGTNSLIRTTMVTTMYNSGVKDNVIPSFASAVINCRILPGQTVKEVEEYISHQVQDKRISITRTGNCWDAPPQTSINSAAYLTIKKLLNRLMPEVVTTPLFVVGTTDARFFREISDAVINFLPVTDSKGMHGIDERRALDDYIHLIRFFSALMIGEKR